MQKGFPVFPVLNVWSLATQMSYGHFCTHEAASGMLFDRQETLFNLKKISMWKTWKILVEETESQFFSS